MKKIKVYGPYLQNYKLFWTIHNSFFQKFQRKIELKKNYALTICVFKTFLGQQEKLKTALTCVGNAEKTVENYKDFLKTEKYKEWNEQQNKKQEDHVKEMIGEFIVKKTFYFLLKIRCQNSVYSMDKS